MTIFLSGFPSSGKTSLGKKVAKKLALPFYDVDTFVEKACGCTCREFILQYGEDQFRQIETNVICNLAFDHSCIIALGGGAVLNPLNVKAVKRLGLMIYLKVDKEIIWGRLRSKKAIPAYLHSSDPKQSFERLFALRQPIYESTADIIIPLTCMSEKTMVEKIIEASYGK